MRNKIVGAICGVAALVASSAAYSQTADVEMIEFLFEKHAQDISGGMMRDAISFVPTFRNNTDRPVVGLVVDFVLIDAFGDKYNIPGKRLDMQMGPSATATPLRTMGWEDNPFIHDEPYDQFLGPVTNGTLKATAEIKRTVYGDATNE